MEDLPLGRIAALVSEFTVKDLPLDRTLMICDSSKHFTKFKRERGHTEYQRFKNKSYVDAVHNVLYIKNKLLLIFILRNFNEVNLQYFQIKLQIPAFTMI